VADVREAAALRRTGAAGLVSPPDASPARSTTQTCTRCKRSGAVKVTVSVGDRRWRFCELCLSRADKTTVVTPVTCEHRFSRARNGGYICLDCFEPLPAQARHADDDRHTCDQCTEAGRASLATVLSLGLLGTVLVSIAGATGKVGWVADRLPLPHPAPNGLSLLVVLVLTAGVLWRLNRDKAEKWPAGAEPLAGATWPDLHPDDARPTHLPVDERQVRS
jgi:hypothetical protein